MIICLKLQNQTRRPLNRQTARLLRQAVRTALLQSRLSPRLRVEVGVTLTDEEGIRQLNRRFRQIDRPTDVLSFPLEEDLTPWQGEAANRFLLLGDIVLCREKAVEQARIYGHSYQREMAFLVVHGMLHLLGYDHQTPGQDQAMRQQQRRILTQMGQGLQEA